MRQSSSDVFVFFLALAAIPLLVAYAANCSGNALANSIVLLVTLSMIFEKRLDDDQIGSSSLYPVSHVPVSAYRRKRRYVVYPVSHGAPVSPHHTTAQLATPWSRRRRSTTSAKREELFEEFLAGVDEKVILLDPSSPSPPSSGCFGVVTPSSRPVASSATPPSGGASLSRRLRGAARLSPNSHRPPLSSLEHQLMKLGIYPHIEKWRDYIRQWFSLDLLLSLLQKLDFSHIQVMQTTAALGISITVTKIGSHTPIHPPTLDEDGVLNHLRFSLVQALSAAAQIPLTSPQHPLHSLPLIHACLDAITEHQMLKALMKGELIKGLLPQRTVSAEYTVQRVRELAEGTCLKNYHFMGNGDGIHKTGDLPTDSHLLLYLFSAFLEYPDWMLRVDPVSYSAAQSNSENPLFLGMLPSKVKFPDKCVAIISGLPPTLHPGACVLAVGKQNPPIFALYWDNKPQFSLQGRTGLWDAVLLLLHRIKLSYGGVVRGIHLGSTALDILHVIDPIDES